MRVYFATDTIYTVMKGLLQMSSGYVYILLNPSHRNMIKVGKTTRPPQERADSLSNHSGVPTKFFVAYWVKASDIDALESRMHHELKHMRVNKSREFFNIESKKAIDLLIEIAAEYPYDESGSIKEVQFPCIKCGNEITKYNSCCPKCGKENEKHIYYRGNNGVNSRHLT
jgi:hypothetical protein